MTNLHAPERQPDETQAQYRDRQAASKRAYIAITKPPHQAPAVSPRDASSFWLGQNTNPARKQRRALFIKEHGVRQWKRQAQSVRRLFPGGA